MGLLAEGPTQRRLADLVPQLASNSFVRIIQTENHEILRKDPKRAPYRAHRPPAQHAATAFSGTIRPNECCIASGELSM